MVEARTVIVDGALMIRTFIFSCDLPGCHSRAALAADESFMLPEGWVTTAWSKQWHFCCKEHADNTLDLLQR